MNIGISSVVNDSIIVALLPLAIISIIIWFSSSQRNKRIKKIENALPDMLGDLTETLKSGTSIETALKDISDTRKDPIGDEMRILIKDMKEGIKIGYKLILKNSADRAYIETLEKQEEGLVKALGSL